MSNDIEATPTRELWDEIARQLREPFDPKDVDFRVQGKANEQTGRAQVVAYIDARVVQDRLDAVVGAGNWSFDWTPLIIEKGEVATAKGTLTVYGVSKADAGTASNFEASLGAVSHCFKRAAVHWGIGRYLYSLPAAWVQVEKNGRIAEATLHELRAKLPRPKQQRGGTTQASHASVSAQAEQPTPEGATDPNVLELSKKRATAEQQGDLVERLRKMAFDSSDAAEAWLLDTLGRNIRIDALKQGNSNITIGEIKQCLEAMDTAPQQQQRQPA